MEKIECPLCQWSIQSRTEKIACTKFADHLRGKHGIGGIYWFPLTGDIDPRETDPCPCCKGVFHMARDWAKHVHHRHHRIIAALHAKLLGITNYQGERK